MNKKKLDDSFPIKIDIERMKVALDSPSIQMPPNLTREEKRAFMLECAKNNNS